MTNHYVYILINNKLDKYYVGVRTCHCGIEEDTYMGSSTKMTLEDKVGCDKLILEQFSTREEAIKYEMEVQTTLDVVKDPKSWNCAIQTSTGFDTTGREMSSKEIETRRNAQIARYKEVPSPLKGRSLSDEHKLHLKKARGNRKLTTIAKHKISIASTGINNNSFRPWWYSLNGNIVEVYYNAPKEIAESFGVSFSVFKERFRTRNKGKPRQKEPLKGLIVGRIKND